MKKLCFGTLLNLMYQARNQGVTYKRICDAVFIAFGSKGMDNRDDSVPGHLRTGHDNVPPDVIDAARNTPYEAAIDAFEEMVTPLIADGNQKLLILAIKAVLREDDIPDDTVIGYTADFKKSSIIEGKKFYMSPLLASLFRYSIVEVSNHDCVNNLKDFGKYYLSSVDTKEQIFIDPLEKVSGDEEDESSPLERTIQDRTFGRTFREMASVIVAGSSHPSTATIFCADINNCKLRFNKVKDFLIDNIGSYVFSRVRTKHFEHRPASALGAQALIQFQKAYGKSAEVVLGELMLYVFLEEALGAPKIMSKIELSQHGGVESKSDGIHLIATNEFGRPFNQLVFGASNIDGNLEMAVDRAFQRIIDIEKNADIEYRTVENTASNILFDDATNEFIRDIMVPRKHYTSKPDMAFGLFLGYTLELEEPETDSALYRVAAEKQLRQDVESIKSYIYKKIEESHLEGYTFYCYVLPFNDAPSERMSLIDEML